jgi:hypothetical protein
MHPTEGLLFSNGERRMVRHDPYGRHYNTAMAIMILDVCYRHMPLYGDEAVHDQF